MVEQSRPCCMSRTDPISSFETVSAGTERWTGRGTLLNGPPSSSCIEITLPLTIGKEHSMMAATASELGRTSKENRPGLSVRLREEIDRRMTSTGAWVHLSKPTEAADNVVGLWGPEGSRRRRQGCRQFHRLPAAPGHDTTTPSPETPPLPSPRSCTRQSVSLVSSFWAGHELRSTLSSPSNPPSAKP